MASPSWLEILEDGLRTRHLPNRYRRRAMRELKDHAEEILCHDNHSDLSPTDQETLLTQRLGDAQHVAATLARTYRHRFFAGRHPIITFLLGPIPLGLLLWCAVVGSLSLPAWIAHACGCNIYSGPCAQYLNAVVWIGFNIVPVGIVMLYAWLAHRSAVGSSALICSTALLALFFGSLCGRIQFPVEGPGTGMVFLGISSHLLWARTISMIVAVGAMIQVKRYGQARRGCV